MRLIDADVENSKLLDFITQNDTAIGYAIEHKDRTMLEGIFVEYFSAQKTAYDVSKVVAELEFLKYPFVLNEYNSKEKVVNRAIDIVRRGGVE